MAEIYPFRALHYNTELVSDLGKVVTQPYDKISPEMQARYYEASPANLVRVILRRKETSGDANYYQNAANEFQKWIDDRILIPESQPAIYPYMQEFQQPGDRETVRQRRGFIALCRLQDYSEGVVHRHEETLSGPKADRMELLKATRTNFGHIFMLYSDRAAELQKLLDSQMAAKPWEEALDEYRTIHRVWRVTDATIVEQFVEMMRNKKLAIADGHHRYETSLAYARERHKLAPEDDRANYVMATFVAIESPGLVILPTHRVVHSLAGFDWEQFCSKAAQHFKITPLEISGDPGYNAAKVRMLLLEAGQQRPAFVAYAGPTRAALLQLKPDANLAEALPEYPPQISSLDVVALHGLIIDKVMGIDRQAVREQRNLRYSREIVEALNNVNSGEAQLAFLMNPTPIKDVTDNAFAGRVLPQKSTDFYPKLLSGLTMYWMDNPAGM